MHKKFALFVPPLLGLAAACLVLFILRFPPKYVPAMVLFLLVVSLLPIIKDLEKLFLAGFLLFLPLDLGLKLFQTYETTNSRVEMLFKFYLVDIFLLGLLAFWLIRVLDKRYQKTVSIRQDRITTAFVLWIGMGLFSIIPAVDKTAAGLGALNIVRVFAIFLLIFHYYRSKGDLEFIIKWLTLGFFAESILVVAQYATGSLLIDMPGTSIGFDIVGQGFRPTGTLGHSGHFAKYSGMMLPILLGFALYHDKMRSRLFYAVAWLMGSLALILTISRVGIAVWILSIPALFIGLLVLGIIPKSQFTRVSITAILIFAFSLGTAYLSGGRRLVDRMRDDEGSTAMRVPTFKVALNIIRHQPFLGVGLGNYTLRHQEYDTTNEQISIRFPSSQVHNLFLLYASEIGIPGLLFFLWFLWLLMKDSVFNARFSKNPPTRAAFLGILLGVSSLVLQSMTGKGVVDRMIHLAIMAVFAGVVSKQTVLLKDRFRKQSI